MAPIYKIATIQLVPKDVAVEDNFNRAEAFIRQAATQGAHLAVLPEYHLTSWCPDHPDFIAACAESATYLPRYQALARDLNINIVPGTICEVHPASTTTAAATSNNNNNNNNNTDQEIRNMAYWIEASTGNLLSSYQKVNLWHSERPHLTAGVAQSAHRAFDTPLTWGDSTTTTTTTTTTDSEQPHQQQPHRPIRAGLLICWDLAFPEAFRALVRDGAELIVIPSFWVCDTSDLDATRLRLNPDCEGLFINSVLVARAFENECVVVYCNAPGLSQVAIEREYKVRRDLEGEGWHYGYEVEGGK